MRRPLIGDRNPAWPVTPDAYGRDISQLRPDLFADATTELGVPRSVAQAVVRDLPSTVVPDEWFPHATESISSTERIQRWGSSAITAFRSSPDQWGLFHRFGVVGTEDAAILIDQIDRVPGATTSRDDAIAVGRSIGERLREMLAATTTHPIKATGRVARKPRLRKLWTIEGEVADHAVELTAAVTTTDALLDLTSWKFRGWKIDLEGRVGDDELSGRYRDDAGSFRTGGDVVAWSPGRLELNGTALWYGRPNVRGASLATWIDSAGQQRDTRRGTLHVDGPIVALGPDAHDRRLVALIGTLFLITSGVYQHDPRG